MEMTTVVSLLVLVMALVLLKFLPRLLAGVPFVSPSDLKARMDHGEVLLVIDVRTADEFIGAFGHVPGSLNLPLSELRARLEDVQERLTSLRTTPIFLMCLSANRAGRAARLLRQAGLANIHVVEGGMIRWTRMGLPTTTGHAAQRRNKRQGKD